MSVGIVVSEDRLRSDLLQIVRAAGYPAAPVDCLPDALSQSRARIFLVDVVDSSEIAMIETLRDTSPDAEIIAFGADPSAVIATQARRAGASEFLRKPFDIQTLERALSNTSPRETNRPGQQGEDFLTVVPEMQRRLVEIDRAATSDAAIRIRGESGTGKNHLARRIHQRSPRHSAPYIVVSCAGLTEELGESELFGSAAGVLRETAESIIGHLETASGGTLLLDEVSELHILLQPKLLRAIQENQITPVGESDAKPLDLRLITTTQKDLAKEVEQGRFREDLFFRLDVIEFRIPPLRERPEDIRFLAHSLLERFARQQGSEPPRLGDACLERLTHHPFRGNVRELQNMMRRATILYAGHDVDADALFSRKVAESIPQATIDTLNLRELEKETIRRALEVRGGNRTQAARSLGISVRTLRNKIQAYDLADAHPSKHAIRAEYVSG